MLGRTRLVANSVQRVTEPRVRVRPVQGLVDIVVNCQCASAVPGGPRKVATNEVDPPQHDVGTRLDHAMSGTASQRDGPLSVLDRFIRAPRQQGGGETDERFRLFQPVT